jgi:hypothetical protein
MWWSRISRSRTGCCSTSWFTSSSTDNWGIASFAELYVRGFLSGDGYNGIPLEMNAYELGCRFESSPRTRFSVAYEASAWVRAGRF